MIDRERRDRFAELLRHFAAGRLTNWEYEDAFEKIDTHDFWSPRVDDGAVFGIYYVAWSLYSDIHEHRMDGEHKLTGEVRREVARWIMFLYSEQEYESPVDSPYWPPPPAGPLSILLTFGRAEKRAEEKRRAWKEWAETEAAEVWPFWGRCEYEEALKRPRLLAGRW